MAPKTKQDQQAQTEAAEQIVSIKAFDHEFKCRGHQFEVGKTYTVSGEVRACRNGFHAVDASDPLHAWDFYPVVDDQGRLTRYAEVLQGGSIDKETQDGKTKIASGSLTVTVELSLPDFIRRAVDAVVKAVRGKGDDPAGIYARIGSSGYGAQIGSSGYGAQIGSSGDGAQIGSSGDGAQIGSSGDGAQIGSSGYGAQIGSSGYGARIGSSGDGARIGSSGDGAQIGSSGDGAQIGSSGYGARIVAEGQKSVIASGGRNATATGTDGTWISLAEFNAEGECVGFASGCIGRDGLKVNTAYRASGGKLVEA